MRKVGVLGTLVWDEIYGRDPASAPVEEWGGIAYALAGFDASLPNGWELVPLIKVGRDLSARATELMRTFSRLAPGARCVEVPVPNNRVTLRYQSEERRCERMSGGVPAWVWSELGPMVADLDALYVNFISGFELGLGTAQALQHGIQGPIYADLHSLLLGMPQDGVRIPSALPDAPAWLGCFDVIQVNEDEMRQLSPDPLALAAGTIAAGVSLLAVTLGPRGAIYVAAPGFEKLTFDRRTEGIPLVHPIRTERVEGERIDVLDPTGCGDVFGAALFSRLLAGDSVVTAMGIANRMAGRAAAYRGASGLARHLRGELLAV